MLTQKEVDGIVKEFILSTPQLEEIHIIKRMEIDDTLKQILQKHVEPEGECEDCKRGISVGNVMLTRFKYCADCGKKLKGEE